LRRRLQTRPGDPPQHARRWERGEAAGGGRLQAASCRRPACQFGYRSCSSSAPALPLLLLSPCSCSSSDVALTARSWTLGGLTSGRSACAAGKSARPKEAPCTPLARQPLALGRPHPRPRPPLKHTRRRTGCRRAAAGQVLQRAEGGARRLQRRRGRLRPRPHEPHERGHRRAGGAAAGAAAGARGPVTARGLCAAAAAAEAAARAASMLAGPRDGPAAAIRLHAACRNSLACISWTGFV
jgi:hypothetical protein